MIVLIPVRITAVQMQNVLILLEATTVLVIVVILEMAPHVKVIQHQLRAATVFGREVFSYSLYIH